MKKEITIKQLTEVLLWVALILAACLMIGYLYVGENFSLFVQDGVTYKLVDLYTLSYKHRYYTELLFNSSCVMMAVTGLLALVNVAFNFAEKA